MWFGVDCRPRQYAYVSVSVSGSTILTPHLPRRLQEITNYLPEFPIHPDQLEYFEWGLDADQHKVEVVHAGGQRQAWHGWGCRSARWERR